MRHTNRAKGKLCVCVCMCEWMRKRERKARNRKNGQGNKITLGLSYSIALSGPPTPSACAARAFKSDLRLLGGCSARCWGRTDIRQSAIKSDIKDMHIISLCWIIFPPINHFYPLGRLSKCPAKFSKTHSSVLTAAVLFQHRFQLVKCQQIVDHKHFMQHI